MEYGVTLDIGKPEYYSNGSLLRTAHFEGMSTLSDSLIIRVSQAENSSELRLTIKGAGALFTGEQSEKWNPGIDSRLTLNIPFAAAVNEARLSPGIEGSLRFDISLWNKDLPKTT